MRTTPDTEGTTGDAALKWDVFVTPGIATVSNVDLPLGQRKRMWSPISSTLIYGKRDAVLVDTFITIDQAEALVDWGQDERQEPDDDLHYTRPRRPLLWHRDTPRPFP